ncbi:MAG: hypothetical protein M1812_000430 [Candelaria pacifica]|nr:MAG: hypothetical protein M1812_000430 [Candelaria pacifica]
MSGMSQDTSFVIPSADSPPQIYPSEEPEILQNSTIGVQILDPSLYYCGIGEDIGTGCDILAKVSEDHALSNKCDRNPAEVFVLKINSQRFAHKCSSAFWESQRKAFRHELQNLVKLRVKPHRHIVMLMCSYTNTEKDKVGVVLSPAGEFDLLTFLSSMNTASPDGSLQFKKEALARWYGCTVTALEYIHNTIKIKHKDIKLQNILVHGNNIKIIDFGISNIVEDSSTTSGPSAGPRYNMAPEVLARGKRRRKQDIWSLGCVFLEMETCRLGLSLAEYHVYRGRFAIADQLLRILSWVQKLLTVASNLGKSSAPLSWIQWMLQEAQNDRPTAEDLREKIEGSEPYFIGKCCSSFHQAGLTAPRNSNMNEEPRSVIHAALPIIFPYGSVAYFLSSSVNIVAHAAPQAPTPDMFRSVLRGVQMGKVLSLRSIEVELLIHLGPARCLNADSYLLFCKAFIQCLIDAVRSGDYTHCFIPDEEKPYTKTYFNVLIGEVLDLCRTQFGGSLSHDSTKIRFLDDLADY